QTARDALRTLLNDTGLEYASKNETVAVREKPQVKAVKTAVKRIAYARDGGPIHLAQADTPAQSPPESVLATYPAATPGDVNPDMQEVRVTGSRLVVEGGFKAPTPVTVVTAQQLTAASPTNLSDSLNQLPVFGNSSTPASNGVSTVGAVGQ